MSQYRLDLRNSNPTLKTYILEPMGEDYTLFPQEEMTVWVVGENVWFLLDDKGDQCAIWLEGDWTQVEVRQGERILECGHQRP